MSNLTVAKLSAKDPSSKRIDLEPGHTIYIPGSVIQVRNTVIYTPTAVSIPAAQATHTNIPDFEVRITPRSLNSRILVQARWFGEFSAQAAIYQAMFGLKRNGVPVGINPNWTGGARGISMASICYDVPDANSTPEMCNFDFMDVPSSLSEVVYQVYLDSVAAVTLYTNRTLTATLGGGLEFGSSTLTAMEIAG